MLRRKCKRFYLVNVCNTNHCLPPSIQWSQVLGARKTDCLGWLGRMTPKTTTTTLKNQKEALSLSSLSCSWQNVWWSTAENFIGLEEALKKYKQINERDKQFQMLHTRITLQPNSLPRWRLGRLPSGYFQLQCFMKTQYALMRKNSVYRGSSSSSRKHQGKY